MTGASSNYHERRGLAAAFALCAMATLTLLANHPSSGAHDIADVINSEARNQLIDGVVHGGFIVTLGALIVCFVLLSRYLGAGRVSVVIGLVTFCIGSGALMASMMLDGLAAPAIAARFAGTHTPDNLLMAKTLFVFLGSVVGILMPLGMIFQGVAMFSWSSVIVRYSGWPRMVGALGLAIGASVVVALLTVPATMAAHVLLGGIVLQGIWYFALAAVLLRQGALDFGHAHP
jgi:hypothetical protein